MSEDGEEINTTSIAGDSAGNGTITDMTMIKSILLAALLPLGFAGCTSIPPSPDSSASHPANAQAAQGFVAPPVPRLMNITNMVEVKAVTEPATEPQPGHEQHQAKPKTQEKK